MRCSGTSKSDAAAVVDPGTTSQAPHPPRAEAIKRISPTRIDRHRKSRSRARSPGPLISRARVTSFILAVGYRAFPV